MVSNKNKPRRTKNERIMERECGKICCIRCKHKNACGCLKSHVLDNPLQCGNVTNCTDVANFMKGKITLKDFTEFDVSATDISIENQDKIYQEACNIRQIISAVATVSDDHCLHSKYFIEKLDSIKRHITYLEGFIPKK